MSLLSTVCFESDPPWLRANSLVFKDKCTVKTTPLFHDKTGHWFACLVLLTLKNHAKDRNVERA